MKTPQELAEDIIAFHERRLTRLKQISSKRKGLNALEAHIAEISKWKEVT